MDKNRTIVVKTTQMPPFIKERVERQRLIKAFIKGEISKEELKNKGVEIVSPLHPSDADWNSEEENHYPTISNSSPLNSFPPKGE